ncbi:hypothetical protein NXH67_03295 [Butyrivibrio sp. DSM 10294]|uniref:hypothetical protein n=1 Tax=Butyrivibrio sp. DSM 10294 TaxID=2972457 RepID=UPI00234EBDD1|nr:hypothetical protein [Butyrivibrio sp. DSM 10294]MDC7292539.1 hypothetical protein [Butyrivibrio sp. DSM 10294]
MEIKDFVKDTVNEIESEQFFALKDKLLGEYLSFSFVAEDKITQDNFSEKVCDYFEKVELKNLSTFDKIFQKYVSNWDDIVKKYIPREPSVKKGQTPPPTPRSRKYYLHAMEIKNSRSMTIKQKMDYSRIMMCLYMAAIDNEGKEIENFELSSSCLKIDRIITAMKSEKPGGLSLPIGKKMMFDLSDLYCTDTSTFILTMIMFYYIKNNEITGEY